MKYVITMVTIALICASSSLYGMESEDKPNKPSETVPTFQFGSSKKIEASKKRESVFNIDTLLEALTGQTVKKPNIESIQRISENLKSNPDYYAKEVDSLASFKSLGEMNRARESVNDQKMLVWEWLTPEEHGYVRITRKEKGLPILDYMIAETKDQKKSKTPSTRPETHLGPQKTIQRKHYEKK